MLLYDLNLCHLDAPPDRLGWRSTATTMKTVAASFKSINTQSALSKLYQFYSIQCIYYILSKSTVINLYSLHYLWWNINNFIYPFEFLLDSVSFDICYNYRSMAYKDKLYKLNVLYTVSQKTSPSFISRSLVKHCSTLIIFGRNIPEVMQLDGVILFPTSPNWCFCTTWETITKQKSSNFVNFLIILSSHLVNQTSNLHI